MDPVSVGAPSHHLDVAQQRRALRTALEVPFPPCRNDVVVWEVDKSDP
jgi:hypothetical protein